MPLIYSVTRSFSRRDLWPRLGVIGRCLIPPSGPDPETPTSDPDPDACIPGWYCAYFGTYTVDVKNGVWVTHVLSANAPGYLNTEQPRHFKIDGNTLVVSETYLSGSTRINAERIFVREVVPGP